MKRLPMSVRLIIMKILGKQKRMSVMFEDVIDHLINEKEKLKTEKIHREKQELKKMAEILEMGLEYTKFSTGGVGLAIGSQNV